MIDETINRLRQNAWEHPLVRADSLEPMRHFAQIDSRTSLGLTINK